MNTKRKLKRFLMIALWAVALALSAQARAEEEGSPIQCPGEAIESCAMGLLVAGFVAARPAGIDGKRRTDGANPNRSATPGIGTTGRGCNEVRTISRCASGKCHDRCQYLVHPFVPHGIVLSAIRLFCQVGHRTERTEAVPVESMLANCNTLRVVLSLTIGSHGNCDCLLFVVRR